LHFPQFLTPQPKGSYAPHECAVALVLAVSAAVACNRDNAARPLPTGPSLTTGVPINDGSREVYTIAAIGDMPYGAAKFAQLPSLLALINSDPKVDIVAHVGDIKAGKNSECTDKYFSDVKALYDALKDPFIYTPGDNEWTDCHSSKGNGFYTPTERLHAIRELFFPVPGQSLGGRQKQLLTQADDPANSDYVENVIWMEAQVVFSMLDITGSNNDLAAWGAVPPDAVNWPTQAQEFAARAKANAAWLDKTFATAKANGAAGVAIFFQADMWDPAEPTLTGFDALVTQIGSLAAAFGKPVLLVEGDSHKFTVDNPYSAASPLHGLHPGTPVADNVIRLVVEGSDAGRTEYTRITIDSKKAGAALFGLERVPLN
jgi:hypothetical protein